ncbi:hypothetical protein PFICI_00916 [Pestalotiopsis fici W106-1]|uniref:NACHT domain-containing protein n=1 Tax=Pestalotiopsis fici (strain W106-1 / CGMCC3.15140) TaxID=1229662 RepID=W3XM01_PESFW|nr:uncharacterized protein PFICI_00916 [Pestalotiopsis fici W106-1]ETS87088.1 hypothetical protein PFICI_00916 [Pestalotiopsis fici W106-1]
MEPITALAFAGNVLQFVEFAFKIARAGHAFYRTEDGSEGGLELEDVYERLQALSGQLSLTINNGMSRDEKAVAELGTSCRADCDHLLQIIQTLRSQGQKWKSFRSAVRYVWKDKQEIEALQSRLRDKQQILNLHISSITSKTLKRLDGDFQRLSELNAKNEVDHELRLDKICQSLEEIKDMLSSAHGANQSISASDVETLASQLSQVSLSERDVAKEQAILYSLDYERRSARYEAISEAHKATFNWVFDDVERKGLGAEKFLDWIKTSGEVFWISGKPGSGKSTFMKFVAGHEQILKAASLWSDPDEVIIASHYFWKAGESMQKSQAGFLQGLLYDILRQKPHITQAICGRQWGLSVPNAHLQRWTLQDLQQSFDTLSTNDSLKLKIVLFVDGLDEYEGDHIDLCLFLKDLARNSSNIKICAASRPENAFEDSFGSDLSHRINIHELTSNDVLRYSQSRLTEHPRWTQITKESRDLQSVCQDIANRAQGVFLWVKLVTQSLRDGMTGYDTAEELESRLDSLPSDLESLYRHLLLSVDPQYHQKMAEILLMMSDMGGSQHWELFVMHEKSYQDVRYAHKITLPNLDQRESAQEILDEWESERITLTRRLMSRCRGLLEIKDQNVEWIHRTAHDFIKSDEMQNYLGGKCRPNFNSAMAELRARVACVTTTDGVLPGNMQIRHLLSRNRSRILLNLQCITFRIWDYYSGAPLLGRTEELEAFDLLDRLAQKLLPHMDGIRGKTGVSMDQEIPIGKLTEVRNHALIRPIDHELVPEFVLANCLRYGLHKLRMDPDYFRYSTVPALRIVLEIYVDGATERAEITYELLKNGYELNRGFLLVHEAVTYSFLDERATYSEVEPYNLKTPWICYIEAIGLSSTYGSCRHVEKMLHWYRWQKLHIFGIVNGTEPFENRRSSKHFIHNLSHGFLSKLLHYGADPNAQSTPFTTAWTSFVCAGVTQHELLQAENAYLEALDGFLQNGTDLGASTIGLTLDPGSTRTRLPWKMITGWDMFCEHLEHEALKHDDKRMLPFTAKITTRMIKYAIHTQWPFGRLAEILAKVFPNDLRAPMMQLIEQTPTGQSRKRRAHCSPDLDRLGKHPRIEDVTEAERV